MGQRRKPHGLISSYLLACVLLLTVSLQESNGVPFVEEDSIENGPVELVNTEEDLIWNGRSHASPVQFPPQTRREKRGLDYDYEEPIKCLIIQSKSATPTTRPTVPINLMDLLNNGSRQTAQEDTPQIKDAILIMGNRGSGKATLIRLLTKDLGGLIAGLTRNGNMVIIDTDDGIKAAPSTLSKVMPELVIKEGADNGTTAAFYDIPYFDESRGPEQDIAVNYFMKQTMSKLARVKMIFTISQSAFNSANSPKSSSSPMGKDSFDFDYLVTNATNFLRDIPTYSKSFGLVITKVSNSDDKAVLDGIVQFLTTYLDNLRSQLESNSTDVLKSALERKIQFVEVLLEQDEQGKYVRIHFSRSPTECGPLSHSREATAAKEGITRLYSETLEYGQVNPKEFGDTLTNKSKLLVADYLSTLNEEISTQLRVLMDDFRSWHDEVILETPDLVNKTKKILATTKIFKEILAFLNNVKNNSTLEKLMEGIMQNLGELGYNVSQHDQQNFKHNLSYVTFFEEVSDISPTLFKEEWRLPIENVKAELEEEETATKQALRSYVIPINQIITEEVTALVSNFTECYLQQISQATDWSLKLKMTQEGNEAIIEAISQMDGLGDDDYPDDFAIPLVALLDKLGCNNSSAFQDGTREAQVYFQYDEKVNPPGVPRAMGDWMAPVAELGRRFRHLEETAKLSFEINKRETEIAGLVQEVEGLKNQLETQNATVELYTYENTRLELEHKNLQETHAQTKEDFISAIQMCRNSTTLNIELIGEMEDDNKRLLNENIVLRKHIQTLIQQNRTLQENHVQIQDDLNSRIKSLENETKLNQKLIQQQAEENRQLQTENMELRRGILDKLRRLERYNLLKFMNANQNSGLHIAAKLKDLESLKVLVEYGENVNLQNKNGETPLILSAVGADTDSLAIVEYLMDHEASPYFADTGGRTFLHKLVANGSSLTTTQFRDLVEFTVAKNISSVFNIRDSKGITPLMLAVRNIHMDKETFALLRGNEVDVTLVDEEARSLRYYINQGNLNLELLSELHQLGTSDVMELNVAIQYMNENAIKILIKIGDNSRGNGSLIPLHIAAASTNKTFAVNAIKLLLQYANPIVLDGEGQIFLHKLVGDGTTLTASEFQDLAEFIVERNISHTFNIQDKPHGRTPLMLAAKNVIIDEPLFNLLRGNRVDVNLPDKLGKSLDFYITGGGINRKLLPVFNTERGSITSTNFPHGYNSNENRYWTIAVSKGKKVKITFEEFSTESGYDWLIIMEEISQQRIKKAEGTYLPSPLVSQSNQVKLNFRSDGGTNYSGFKLRWESCVDCITNYNG